MEIPNVPGQYYSNVENSIIDYDENLWQDILRFSKTYDDDIKISVCVTSIRTYLWKWLYTTLLANHSNFELVISGPNVPDFELPKNFKYIYSITKPMQSLQLSILKSRAETIVCIADDCQSGPGTLDLLYKTYKYEDNYKCTAVPNFIEKTMNLKKLEQIVNLNKITNINTNFTMRLVYGIANSPIAHVGGLMSRKFFDELGGFDTRFIARFADLDLQMRAHKNNGIFRLVENSWMAERHDLCKNDRAGHYEDDWNTWLSLWFSNSNYNVESLMGIRNGKFFPYIDDTTLHEVNQGRTM